jgi:aminopeptidase N
MWTRFEATPPMSTYLVAVTVTDFKSVDRVYKTQRGRIPIRFWAQPRHLPRVVYAADLSPKVVMFLEKHLLVPYSLTKMDYVALTGRMPFAAMENWGLVTFK